MDIAPLARCSPRNIARPKRPSVAENILQPSITIMNALRRLRDRLKREESSQRNHQTAQDQSEPSAAIEASSPRPKAVAKTEALTISQGLNLGLKTLFDPPEAVVDIVFVHGLTGNAYNTWHHASSDVHWPQDLLKTDFEDARIFAFGYDAAITQFWGPASSNRVGNHAEDMLGSLSRRRIRTNTEDRKIIFIVHSLGGLVTQNALTLSNGSPDHDIKKIERNTIAIGFLGTPHHGSDLAAWGTFASNMTAILKRSNKDIIAVLKPHSEILSVIQTSFHRLLATRRDADMKIEITCFYETIPLRGVGDVVPKHSAIIPEYKSYGIRANHMDMTKFKSIEDPGYETVSGEIFGWLRNLRLNTDGVPPETPEAANLLKSLSFEGIVQRQESIDPAHAETFRWIWSRKSVGFTDWLRNGSGIYWISGKPGSGKSTMMKHVVEDPQNKTYLHERISHSSERRIMTTAVYFFDYKGNKLTKSIEGMLRSILYQITSRRPTSIKWVIPHISSSRNILPTSLTWPHNRKTLENCLKDILRHDEESYFAIFVDALDEYYGEDDEIGEFFSGLAAEFSGTLQICISSRPHADFQSLFGFFPSLRMEEETKEDVRKYVTSKFQPIIDSSGPSYQELTEQVVLRAQGLFLWVKLASAELSRAAHRAEDLPKLLDRLNDMPEEFNDFYQRILDELVPEDRDEAKAMISIVMTSQRVLQPLALRHAMNFALGMYHDLDGQTLAEKRILSVCEGLLEFSIGHVGSEGDRGSSPKAVRLAHQTVYKFFSTRPESLQSIDRTGNRLTGHVILARACVKALVTYSYEEQTPDPHFVEFRTDVAPYPQPLDDWMFTYARQWWAFHVQRADKEADRPQPELDDLDGASYADWRSYAAMRCEERWEWLDFFYDMGVSREMHKLLSSLDSPKRLKSVFNTIRGLSQEFVGGMVAEELPSSLLGLALMLRFDNWARNYILTRAHTESPICDDYVSLDVNENGGSLLYQVARGGNLQIAEQLISLGAKLTEDLPWAASALCRAIYFGHFDITKLLLRNNAQPHRRGVYFRQFEALPMTLAIKSSHSTSLVRLLCKNGYRLNSRLSFWGTALQEAIIRSKPKVVDLLIKEFGADVNTHTHRSVLATPIETAIYAYYRDLRFKQKSQVWRQAQYRIIEDLLSSGASPDTRETIGTRNMLACALDHGLLDVFELLLSCEPKHDWVDDRGHTLLFRVLTNGTPNRGDDHYQPLDADTRQSCWEKLFSRGARLNSTDLAALGKADAQPQSQQDWINIYEDVHVGCSDLLGRKRFEEATRSAIAL